MGSIGDMQTKEGANMKSKSSTARKDNEFRKQLLLAMDEKQISYQKLADLLGVHINTVYNKRDHTETVTLRERRILLKVFPDMKIE